MLQLYHYDHCPFCVRIRMYLGLSKTPCYLHTLCYDDAPTPTQLVGKKILPILLTAQQDAMPESMDIIDHLEQQRSTPFLSTQQTTAAMQDKLSALSSVAGNLYKPRVTQLPLGEFASASAIEYYTTKHSNNMGMTFTEALERTNEWVAIAQPILDWIDTALATHVYTADHLSLADINLFPRLRNLGVVKALHFKKHITQYIQYYCQTCTIQPYPAMD